VSTAAVVLRTHSRSSAPWLALHARSSLQVVAKRLMRSSRNCNVRLSAQKNERRRRVVLRLQSAAIKSFVDSICPTIGGRASFSEWDGVVCVPGLKHHAALAGAQAQSS
jgi:hypothetical protein